jgi:protein TonB
MSDRALSLSRGTALSTAVHAAVAGLLYLWAFGYIHISSSTLSSELDLSQLAPLAPVAGTPERPEAPWLISHKRVQPAPPKLAKPVEAPVPEAPESVGTWVPAALTARKPQWMDNFITPADYPPSARQQGADGRVVLRLHIDESGHVQEVKLLQGSNQELNEVAVRKLSRALFSPAYTAQGSPVACEVILPIKFQLK